MINKQKSYVHHHTINKYMLVLLKTREAEIVIQPALFLYK